MRRLLSLVAAMAALSLSTAQAGSSWIQQGHDATQSAFNSSERGIGPNNVARLHPVWTRSLPALRSAIEAGNRIYAVAGSGHSNVYVIDSASGRVLRIYSDTSLHLNPRIYDDPQAVAYANRRLVIAAERTVLEINPQTNQEYWQVPGGADQVQIAGRTVYTGKGCQNACGTVASYSIDLYSGEVHWVHPGNFGGTPTLIRGRLYQRWGEATGTTRVYDPASGALLATMRLNAHWTGDGKHAFANAMTGGYGGPIHKWISEIGGNGKSIWTTDLGKGGDAFPIFAYGNLYVPSNRFQAGIAAVNATNGRIRWAAAVGVVLRAVAANHLVYALQETTSRVSILNADNGRLLRTLAPRAPTYGVAQMMVAGGTLYLESGQAITAYRV
jgi:hypothetical protein